MSKRTSTRTTVVSKAMRKVDSDTRKEAKDKRLRMLEADNYNDEPTTTADDDDYSDDNEEAKTKKRKVRAKSGASLSRSVRKVRELDRILDSQIFSSQQSTGVSYISVTANPSVLPTRHFCSVCGFWGTYSCSRCGMRYCSSRCSNHHKETRCLKFSM